MMYKKKILFFGLGSIGQRHAKLIQNNYDYELFAYRNNKKNKHISDIEEVYTLKGIARIKPDIIFITNPTSMHIDSILSVIKLKPHFFIEKPLCEKIDDRVSKLLDIIKKDKLVTYVACQLRFHPIIQYIKKIIKGKKIFFSKIICSSFLPDWRPNRDYRNIYSAHKHLGGGVILDLIHEPDYCYWLFGSIKKIKGVFGQISNLEIDSEDFANLSIVHDSGMLSNVYLDYFGKTSKREIEIFAHDFNVHADILKNVITIRTSNEEQIYFGNLNNDDIYLKQLNYFFNCIENKQKPMNNINDHLKILYPIISFKVSSQKSDRLYYA